MPQSPIDAAKAVIQHHIRTLNAGDPVAQAESFHFPLVRLASGKLRIWATAEEWIAEAPERQAHFQSEGWHHSVMEPVTAVQSSEDKVHLAIVNDRCREDSTVYKTFDTLWIATKLEGRWAVQFRSSFHER